jgi:hypothetical protein
MVSHSSIPSERTAMFRKILILGMFLIIPSVMQCMLTVEEVNRQFALDAIPQSSLMLDHIVEYERTGKITFWNFSVEDNFEKGVRFAYALWRDQGITSQNRYWITLLIAKKLLNENKSLSYDHKTKWLQILFSLNSAPTRQYLKDVLLHIAASMNSVDLAYWLLESGADRDFEICGQTAVDKAKKNGYANLAMGLQMIQ